MAPLQLMRGHWTATEIFVDYGEALAHRALVAFYPDADVVFQADQSNGQHDLTITFTQQEQACVEVASIVDELKAGTVAAILNPNRGGDYVPTRTARHGWYVTPRHGANINKIRLSLDKLLANLDSRGITEFDLRYYADETPDDLRASLEALGLEYGQIVSFVPDGMIQLALPPDGGWVNPSAVNVAVAQAAARPDNLRKVSAGDYQERHLFVYMDSSATDPHGAMIATDEVAPPLSLSGPITHLWAGVYLSDLDHAVVWKAKNGCAWARHELALPTLT